MIHELFAYLRVRDAARAIEFYKEAFGVSEKFRLNEPGTGRVGHAELDFGGTTLMLSDEYPELGILGPESIGGTSLTIHLHVDDCDALIRRAAAAGATVLREPSDAFYGERGGTVRDPFGHEWMIGHEIEKVEPDEMQRRYDRIPAEPQPRRTAPVALEQINIVVRDMEKAVAFYRLLGVRIDDVTAPEWAAWARHHVNGTASNGVRVELDSVWFAKQWNPGLDEARLGGAVIPIFHVASRDEVDRVHARVAAAGHRTHQAPEDAFWGARYAIVEDPDGTSVGIMSPIDDAMRREPPPLP